MDALLTILIPLLIQVESSGNPNAVNKKEDAVGILQIRQCVIEDVNRIYQTKYTEKDRLNKAKSMSICRLYLKYYGTRYQLKTGKKADIYILASMWCAGPDGYKQIKNENVQKYIEKVKKAKGLYEQQAEKD
jgi:poly-D-alanine transfer protein DltD